MDKIRERAHLDRFIELFPHFPSGEIECNESPDFKIHSEDMLLGIEHTEMLQPGLPHGDSLQAQDNLTKRVVSKAKNLYQQIYSQPLLVEIFFNPNIKIKKQHVNYLAEIVFLLVSVQSIVPGTILFLEREIGKVNYLRREIISISIYGRPIGTENIWHSISVGWIPEIIIDQLQEKISEKEDRLDTYHAKCSEVWLLIVSEYIRIPTSVDLSPSVLIHRFTTRFNRVFFLWYSLSQYIELKTQ